MFCKCTTALDEQDFMRVGNAHHALNRRPTFVNNRVEIGAAVTDFKDATADARQGHHFALNLLKHALWHYSGASRKVVDTRGRSSRHFF